MNGRSGGTRAAGELFVFGLVAADLFAGEAELFGDVGLLDALAAGVEDGAAEGVACFGDLAAGGHVGVAGCEDVAHLAGHLSIMPRVGGQVP